MIRRRRAALLALLFSFALPLAAYAQNTPNAPRYSICKITNNTPVTCKTGSGQIIGVENVSQTAQTATVECLDGGSVIKEIGGLGITQQINYPSPGTPYGTNLVCTATGTVIATGIFIYFY